MIQVTEWFLFVWYAITTASVATVLFLLFVVRRLFGQLGMRDAQIDQASRQANKALIARERWDLPDLTRWLEDINKTFEERWGS